MKIRVPSGRDHQLSLLGKSLTLLSSTFSLGVSLRDTPQARLAFAMPCPSPREGSLGSAGQRMGGACQGTVG